MNQDSRKLENLDEMQWDITDAEVKFNAYADSSIDLLNVTKRMLGAGLHKEAVMSAEDYVAHAYCAEQMLQSLIEKKKKMDDLINQDEATKEGDSGD